MNETKNCVDGVRYALKAVREGNARIVTERAKQFLEIVRDARGSLT